MSLFKLFIIYENISAVDHKTLLKPKAKPKKKSRLQYGREKAILQQINLIQMERISPFVREKKSCIEQRHVVFKTLIWVKVLGGGEKTAIFTCPQLKKNIACKFSNIPDT